MEPKRIRTLTSFFSQLISFETQVFRLMHVKTCRVTDPTWRCCSAHTWPTNLWNSLTASFIFVWSRFQKCKETQLVWKIMRHVSGGWRRPRDFWSRWRRRGRGRTGDSPLWLSANAFEKNRMKPSCWILSWWSVHDQSWTLRMCKLTSSNRSLFIKICLKIPCCQSLRCADLFFWFVGWLINGFSTFI